MMNNEQKLFHHYAGHALAGLALSNSGDPALAGALQGLFGKKPAAQYESKPYLSLGSSGDDVKIVQAKVGRPQTGTFDSATEQAVKAFQMSKGLNPSGMVDDRTWAAILGERFKDSAASAAAATSTISTIGSQVQGLLSSFITPPANQDAIMQDPGSTTVAPTAPTSALTYVAIGGTLLLIVAGGGYVLYRATR